MARLCVALDTSKEKALQLVDQLKEYPLIYKIGYKLFIPYGVELIKEIQKRVPNSEIFLDLKLHDIPNTVRNGVFEASQLGVSYLTVHAMGGKEMISAAAQVKGNTKLLGVTLLTSHDEEYLKELSITLSKEDFVLKLAQIALSSGADGLVCSAHEVEFLKKELGNFLAVVPGIRPQGKSSDDQKRVATPKEAVDKGADILVVGRPIVQSSNPKKVVEDILTQIGF